MDSTSNFIRSTMAIDECVNFVDSFSWDQSPKMNLTILLVFLYVVKGRFSDIPVKFLGNVVRILRP